MIVMELPFPPSNNTYYRHSRGRHFISKAGLKFREAVSEYASVHRLKADPGRLFVSVYLFPPDKRIRDVDNYLKGLLDSLIEAGVIEDDSLIDRILVERLPVVKGGKTRVFINAMPDQTRDIQ